MAVFYADDEQKRMAEAYMLFGAFNATTSSQQPLISACTRATTGRA